MSFEARLFEARVTIDASAEKVWSVLADVERWPEWTASVTSIELLTDAPMSSSSRLRIKQPRLRALIWDVTEFVPGEALTWRSSTLGVTSVGSHRISAESDGGVTVTLGLSMSGWLAPVIGSLTSRLTHRYVDMEARGLKARSESEVSSSER